MYNDKAIIIRARIQELESERQDYYLNKHRAKEKQDKDFFAKCAKEVTEKIKVLREELQGL